MAYSKVVTSDANNVVTFSGGISEDSVTISSSSNAATINLREGTSFLHDLTTYLTSVSVVDGTQAWKTGELDSDGNEIDFVPSDAATSIWNDLDTLNA